VDGDNQGCPGGVCHDRASEGIRAVEVVAMVRDARGDDWNQRDTK
jgi:hypothetical protein